MSQDDGMPGGLNPDPIYDDHRDPALVAQVAAVADRVFASLGIDASGAVRAPGWSNGTWLTDGVAVRVQFGEPLSGQGSEMALVQRLPAEAGHPQVLASGVDGGHRWMATRLVRGTNLGDAWAALSWAQREVALVQLWEKAQAGHRDLSLVGLAGSTSPFYPVDLDQARSRLARVEAVGGLLPDRQAEAERVAAAFFDALPRVDHVLTHGDLSPVNAVWDGTDVVALLDFEFAVAAPIELDLHELLKCAYAPGALDVPVEEPLDPGRISLQDTVAELASALANPTYGRDLILGYAVLDEAWAMERWLVKWDGVQPFDDWRPHIWLNSLLDGRGGYLHDVLDRLSHGV